MRLPRLGWHVTPTGQVRRCMSTTCHRVGVIFDRYQAGLRDYPTDPMYDSARWFCGMSKEDAESLARDIKKRWTVVEKGHRRANW